MCDITNKKGRKRTLSDEERELRKKESNGRRIQFSTPIGFKEIFMEFIGERDVSIVLLSMIKNDKEFKDFKIKKGAI